MGRGNPEKLTDFIEEIERHLGPAQKDFLPMQPGDVNKTYADISRARELINYSPRVDIREGVKEFVDWFNHFYSCT